MLQEICFPHFFVLPLFSEGYDGVSSMTRLTPGRVVPAKGCLCGSTPLFARWVISEILVR